MLGQHPVHGSYLVGLRHKAPWAVEEIADGFEYYLGCLEDEQPRF